MATTLNAVTFMGKNYSTTQNVVQNEDYYIETECLISLHKRSTMMTKFIVWIKSCIRGNSWTKLSLIDDPVIIGLQSTKVYVFSDSVLSLGKVLQHPECNEAWKKQVCRSTSREELQRF